jgi:hypothetical protein
VIQGMLPLMPEVRMAMQLVHHDDIATAGERGSPVCLQPGCGQPRQGRAGLASLVHQP